MHKYCAASNSEASQQWSGNVQESYMLITFGLNVSMTFVETGLILYNFNL